MFKTLEHFDYGLAMGMVYALAMRCTEFDSPQVHHVLEPLIDGYPFTIPPSIILLFQLISLSTLSWRNISLVDGPLWKWETAGPNPAA